MGEIRNSVFTKILWGLIALYLLNISVDAVDPNPEHIPEDLSINDQETIIEIVVEQILGFENAIEEYDDHDTEDHSKRNAKIDLIVRLTNDTNISQLVIETTIRKFPDLSIFLTAGFHQLFTPPPKR